MDTKPSQEFLTRCFSPAETIALLLRREEPATVTQRIVRLETVLAPPYMRWLSHENANGANIYVAANPLRAGSRKRTKENIASVRHLYVDIDIDGDTRLAWLRASDAVPTPSAILSTSPGKYQVLWHVEGFDFDTQESTLKELAITFGGDPACTDRNRVLRVPGFLNRKYDCAHWVTVEYPCASVWMPVDFHLETTIPNTLLFSDTIPLHKHPGKQSTSENDWAWVSTELARGKDAVKVTRELASRRFDKPNPLYYAQRTVDVASARLWLIEGKRIGDVVTMLESRRRIELPAALCHTRAPEITQTAMRMIARKSVAHSTTKETHNATT